MVASNPIGGLGNQLFQIFATIAYGIQYGRRIVFTYKEKTGGQLSRTTYWHNFLQNLQIFTTKYNKITNEELMTFTIMKEQGHHYTELQGHIEPNILLSGYYQSYKYFEKYMDKILKLIKFHKIREQVLTDNNDLFHGDFVHVSMHFRLGDYKFLQNCHPILNYDYYEKSLTKMMNMLKNSDKQIKVLYFCEKEDIQIVENKIQKLKKELPTVIFQSVGIDTEDWVQMVIMTLCDHHIIANSTFSWWGAYLNPALNKHVIYPSVWFGNDLEHLRTHDLFPDSWVCVKIKN